MLADMTRFSLILALAFGASACGDDVTYDGLAFNEVQATGITEYIELINIGAEPIDIGGLRLVDQQDGAPRGDQQVTFEAGAQLDPGEILLIQANLGADALPGEREECGPGAPPRCYYAAWGISNSNGETLYVLGPAGERVLTLDYPMNAVEMGAYGRIPDGTGTFANTASTPGRSNAPFVMP